MADYLKVEKTALLTLLKNTKDYISMTKEASARSTVEDSRVEEAIYSLCESGLVPLQKRAQVIDGILEDPNRLCDLLEKIASKVGPSTLGGGDSHTPDTNDAELSFVDFCIN